MKFSLKDGAPRKPGEAELFVSKNANTLEIGMVGQEDNPPVVIEHYDGIVKVRVFGSSDSSPDYIRVIADGGLEFFVNNPGALAIDPASPDGPGRRGAYPAKIVPVFPDDEPRMVKLGSAKIESPATVQNGEELSVTYGGTATVFPSAGTPIAVAPFEPVSAARLDPERGMYYGRNLTPEQIALNRQIIDGTRVERPTPTTQAEVNATLVKGTNGKPQHVYGGRPGYQGAIDPYAEDND